MSAKFRIFGAGKWGLAFGNHLSLNGNQVEIYLRDNNKVKQYSTAGKYENFPITFDDNLVFKHLNKNSLTSNDDQSYNIIATSSYGFSDIVRTYESYFSKSTNISWLTKGIDHETGLLFHQIIDQHFESDIDKCIFSGPSFAHDLIAKKDILISIASNNDKLLSLLADASQSPAFNLRKSNDLIGIEVSGIIKNIVAILSGIASSLGYGDDKISILIDKAKNEVKLISSEITKNCSQMYKISSDESHKTLDSPACHGDMVLSCFDDTSRNRLFGLSLTNSKSIKDLLTQTGTVEGYYCTRTLYKNKDIYKYGEIVKSAYAILYDNSDPRKILESIFN